MPLALSVAPRGNSHPKSRAAGFLSHRHAVALPRSQWNFNRREIAVATDDGTRLLLSARHVRKVTWGGKGQLASPFEQSYAAGTHPRHHNLVRFPPRSLRTSYRGLRNPAVSAPPLVGIAASRTFFESQQTVGGRACVPCVV